jgi:hypothetical protein
MAESSRGNDKVKKEVESLLGAVDSFTHGGIRKVLFLLLDSLSLSLIHTHTHTHTHTRLFFFDLVSFLIFCVLLFFADEV